VQFPDQKAGLIEYANGTRRDIKGSSLSPTSKYVLKFRIQRARHYFQAGNTSSWNTHTRDIKFPNIMYYENPAKRTRVVSQLDKKRKKPEFEITDYQTAD